MKNTDEMVNSLLERRTQYREEKSRKRKAITCTAVLVSSCLAIALGVVFANGYKQQDKNGNEKENGLYAAGGDDSGVFCGNYWVESGNGEEGLQAGVSYGADMKQVQIALFNATQKDSDTDIFGADEVRHVDVILDGNRLYAQLDESDYETLGIGKVLNESDFGEKLGVITEIDGASSAPSGPSSQEPALRDCEVYYYAPVNSKGAIIVKGNGCCSVFAFLNFTEEGYGIKDIYKVFGAETEADVKRIDYSVLKPDGATVVPTDSGSITDAEEISKFVNITLGLSPYVRESALSGDPDWLCAAKEEYKEHKEKHIQVELTVVFENGLSTKLFYQPYLGTGFFSGHYFLANEDNTEIIAMLGV